MDRIEQVFSQTMNWSRDQEYRGWSKHDGLNSPMLQSMLGWSKPTRLIGIQTVMRSPVNLRPLLKVPQMRNAKGIGLFAHALLDRYALTKDKATADEACALLDWLLNNPAQGFAGLSWGYPYPWQDVGFFAPQFFPNRVVTCWIGFAFADAVRLLGINRYKKALARIAEFLISEPNILEDTEDMLCYSYVPDALVSWAVMDVPALMGAFLAEAGQLLGEAGYMDLSHRLLNWVMEKQTDYGGWYYTHPADDSHITHDNYHTGIILDCIDRYRRATGNDEVHEIWEKGLTYYKYHLFSLDGAPHWMNDREYPYDIHGSAAGILCFARAALRLPEYVSTLETALNWPLEYMYNEQGYFYYQRTRHITKRICLLRWCNAWMCRALAYVLKNT